MLILVLADLHILGKNLNWGRLNIFIALPDF